MRLQNSWLIDVLARFFQNRFMFVAIFFALAFLVLGCSEQGVKPSETRIIPSPAITIHPTNAIPTAKPATLTPEPQVKTVTHCQEIVSSQFPDDFVDQGSIIFEGECEGQEGLFNFSTTDHQIVSFLANNKYGKSFLGLGNTQFYVSKDHQWMIFEDSYYDDKDTYLGTFINFIGEDENTLIQYPRSNNWVSLWGWYGNNLAGFSVFRAPDVSIDILDPFSGKTRQFQYPFWGFERAILLFDPPVARVLYFNDADVSSCQYILKEIATDKVLWQSVQDSTGDVFASQPQWSPNGMFFAIPVWEKDGNGSFHFLAVSREGKETVTNEMFHSDPASPYVNFTWSASGKYLVFWNSVDGVGKQLIIWDVANNQHVETGFTTQAEPGLPVFSPDETKFIVNTRTLVDADHYKSTNYLVDIVSGKTIQIAMGLYPVAWLKPIKSGQQMVKPADEPNLLPPKSGSAVIQQPMKVEDLRWIRLFRVENGSV